MTKTDLQQLFQNRFEDARPWASLVADFMKLNDGTAPPVVPTGKLRPEVVALRLHLMMEELGELSRHLNSGDVVEAADAVADLLYVVVGTGVALGLGPILDPLFREVHASNMTKELGPAAGPDGHRRAVKGARYRPPDVAGLLAAHRRTVEDLGRCPERVGLTRCVLENGHAGRCEV